MKRFILILLLIPVLILAAWCDVYISDLSAKRAQMKKDYSEVNNIQYGILSVNSWRDNVTDIVKHKIEDFEFTPDQEAALRVNIENILNAVITQADDMVNERQRTVGGKLKKFAVKTFVKTDKIRKRVPDFTTSIINEIKKPQNKEKLKFLVADKLKQFAADTHDNLATDSTYNQVLAKYNAKDLSAFNVSVPAVIFSLQDKILTYAYILIGCLALFLVLWIVLYKQRTLHTPLFVMSVLLAFIVLWVGLSTPMIEIDARIKEFDFTLIGKQMSFHDQVLFFQSKSILDVVHILLTTGKVDSVLVGVMILAFSVLFPIAKLISTKIYLLGNTKWRTNKVLRFFAFKSGKWSMADVMVVAIFMAYIGFKGIMDSQMNILNGKSETMTTIATNETSLQPGFILFVSYVIFGLILGVILKRITSYEAVKEEEGSHLLVPSPTMKDLKSVTHSS